MARRRMIDPNIWMSEDVAKLTIRQRLLLIGLFSNADDYGKGRANPVFIRSIVFPYDDIPVKDIEKDLKAISETIEIKLYEVDENSYYSFTNWGKWQTVQKPQDSIIPDFECSQERVENDSGMSQERVENDSRLKERKRRERKGREGHSGIVPDKLQFAEYVLLTEKEHQKLIDEYGENVTAKLIDKLNNHKGASGQKYKSDYHAIRKWVVDAVVKDKAPPQPSGPTETELAMQKLCEEMTANGYFDTT